MQPSDHEPALHQLVGCILTRNEEADVADAVRSLQAAADVVVVVDSLSDDETKAVALATGAVVLERPFDNFASQRNWALDQIEATLRPRWVFSLDADERVPPQLADELRQVADDDPEYDVLTVARLVRFSGRILRHGGMASTRLVRMVRPGAGRYENRVVNEHFVAAPDARVGALAAPILHEDVRSWARYIEKHNLYSTLEAEARFARRTGGGGVHLRQAARQPFLRRRWVREQVWERLPGKPILRFVEAYIVRGGFLDGRPGLEKAVFNAWLEMCIDLKYRQLLAQSTDVRSS
jgi:glycosyltransferase involved in cell wall biosynthesis